MDSLCNPYRGSGLTGSDLDPVPFPSVDADAPLALLTACPRAARTPLLSLDALAAEAGVAGLIAKDERQRMGMGSFKALGAAYVIARDAQEGRAEGRVYMTASAGNHGLSVAAGAAAFDAQSVIYLSQTVPDSFAARLAQHGAEVRRFGADYEASMKEAERAAKEEGAVLLSDSSWPGYTALPHRLMEGYLVAMAETVHQIDRPPSHIVLQAGVGGMAGAMAAYARHVWGDAPVIIVAEPAAAPALLASVRAGRAVHAAGPVSVMGRLDCKEPSLIALKGLTRDADHFVTLSEDEARSATATLARHGLETSPSGAAGVAALLAAGEGDFQLGAEARVLVILGEGPA